LTICLLPNLLTWHN